MRWFVSGLCLVFLSSPALARVKPGEKLAPAVEDPEKTEVLIYYANESRPGNELLKEFISRLEANNQELDRWTKKYTTDEVKFPNKVDEEIQTIQQAARETKAWKQRGVIVFTNQLAMQNRCQVKPAGKSQFEEIAFQTPQLKHRVYQHYPLTSLPALKTALHLTVQHFDPQKHVFVLITKSHGSASRCLIPLFALDTQKLSDAEFNRLLSRVSSGSGDPDFPLIYSDAEGKPLKTNHGDFVSANSQGVPSTPFTGVAFASDLKVRVLIVRNKKLVKTTEGLYLGGYQGMIRLFKKEDSFTYRMIDDWSKNPESLVIILNGQLCHAKTRKPLLDAETKQPIATKGLYFSLHYKYDFVRGEDGEFIYHMPLKEAIKNGHFKYYDYIYKPGLGIDGKKQLCSSQFGIVKEEYLKTLLALGSEHGAHFNLVFVESCTSQFSKDLLDPLRKTPQNISLLYASDEGGLAYATLDYLALVKALNETSSLTEIIAKQLETAAQPPEPKPKTTK